MEGKLVHPRGMVLKLQKNISLNNIHPRSRPNLSSIIPNVIYGIESKTGLPEKYTMRSKDEMKKLLTERTLEYDADESLSSANKYAKICQLGMDLGFSMHELIDEIHDSLSETFYGSGQSSTAELQADRTMSPLPPISVDRRRRSAVIVAEDSSTSWTVIEQNHVMGRLSQVRWNCMKKVVNEICPNALLKPSFHPWRENEAHERYVKEIDANVMKTWGIFFCGGSEGVISDLQALSMDYNIDLHIDSFAW